MLPITRCHIIIATITEVHVQDPFSHKQNQGRTLTFIKMQQSFEFHTAAIAELK